MLAKCEENCSAFWSFTSNTIKSNQPGYGLLLGKGNHKMVQQSVTFNFLVSLADVPYHNTYRTQQVYVL